MELTKYLALLAIVLPVAYGAPTDATNTLHPEILAAMKRDLGLNAEEATATIAKDEEASSVIEKASTSIGSAFAGGWIDNGVAYIAVTDESLSEGVTASGATPVVVTNSLSKLEQAQASIDKIFNEQVSIMESTSGVASWFVDVTTNKLVIETLSGSQSEAEQLASQAGLSASDFEVRTVESLPTPFAQTSQGGDAYNINGNSRCSIGFSVTTGFVTAGHCGRQGASATKNGAAFGTFSGSIFPGNDMAYVKTVSGTALTGYVNNYKGGRFPISGSSQAAVGANICRSGSTTGVHCGKVQQHNTSVRYSQGTVNGVTKTSVCAEPGDSGGSFFSGAQAQGVTSGGSGNCRSGGTTYYQPVNPILQKYRLTLVRA